MLQHHIVSKLKLTAYISLSFFLGYLLVFSALSTQAQSSLSYNDQLQLELEKLQNEYGTSFTLNQSLQDLDISKKDKLSESNIYLMILNTYSSQTVQDTYLGMSLATGYSKEEIKDMIEKGQLYPISEGDINQKTNIYNGLISLYEEERPFFQTLAELKIDSLVSEIFTDGNSSNSGYDLITDLNSIENKLFKATTPTSIYSSPTNSDRSNFWRNFTGSPSISNFSTYLNTPADTNTSVTNPNQNNNSSSSNQDPDISLNLEAEYQFPTLEYGAVCPADPDLYDEISIFNDAQNNSNTDQSSSSSSDNSQSNNNSSSTQNTDSSTNQENSSSQPISLDSNFDKSFFESSSSCSADQVFCFIQETVTNKVTLKYPPASQSAAEDCVACVINRLNQSLQTLLDNGVLPKKITGNFGEPPICKEAAFGKIGLNINIFSKPVLSEIPNSSAIQQTNTFQFEQAQNSQSNLSNNPNFSLSQEYRPKTTTDILTQQNSLQTISSFEANLSNEFDQNSIVTRSLQDQKTLFDTLDNQISTLNLYFEGFNSSLESLNLNFQTLANLPECSTL